MRYVTLLTTLLIAFAGCSDTRGENGPAATQPEEQAAATTQPEDPVPAHPKIARMDAKSLSDIEKSNIREPSDMVFHPVRKTLFLVGDQGDLAEMTTEGKILRRGKLRGDCEGITVNPASGLVYVGVEGEERIVEVDPDTLRARRSWNIDRKWEGKVVMAQRGNGIEGITFLPDPKHPHGGTFLVCNQSFDLHVADEWSAVFEVEVPLKDEEATPEPCKLLRYFSLGVTDLAAMHYDPKSRRLWVLSDAANILFECNRAGEVYARHIRVPGRDQEGIAFDDDGNIYLAQDSGGVLKLKWTPPKPQAGAKEAPGRD